MTLRPRHLAGAQYAVIALMLLASWNTLLMPWDAPLRTLRVLFHPEFALRHYFIGSAAVTLGSTLVALLWFTAPARRRAVAAGLFVAGLALLAGALRLFDVTMALVNASGCLLALWAWRMPEAAVLGDDPAEEQAGAAAPAKTQAKAQATAETKAEAAAAAKTSQTPEPPPPAG